MKKIPLAVVAIVIILFLVLAFLFIFKKPLSAPSFTAEDQQKSSAIITQEDWIKEDILQKANMLYGQKKNEGLNFSSGPCLGKIADDWVLDIAHDPRQPVDDEAQNQCQDFRNGNVQHFVELDEKGNLIQIL
ncbi:hypothetical protein A2164_01025 [Candidatus Curtissbacteria bacterium RBG_13_35_7]|uniref:Uncharacterized protein n=1 Tax=Candidatus Curtissbacteria bacterium RBG_13_35_7 TaxID=1797705 RepID=A0A1F5G487_9BACT|nr:MAG: hypothetical protein A2164_01025 [Candidatus Curtissbacteria bacterium RBG_13_35_7]